MDLTHQVNTAVKQSYSKRWETLKLSVKTHQKTQFSGIMDVLLFTINKRFEIDDVLLIQGLSDPFSESCIQSP